MSFLGEVIILDFVSKVKSISNRCYLFQVKQQSTHSNGNIVDFRVTTTSEEVKKIFEVKCKLNFIM